MALKDSKDGTVHILNKEFQKTDLSQWAHT